MEEFIAKYGTYGWRLLIEDLIQHAGPYAGDAKKIPEIKSMLNDLESALVAHLNPKPLKCPKYKSESVVP